MEPSLRALEAGVIRINQALGLALLVRNDEANLRKVRDAAFTAAQAGRPCRRLGALLEAEVDAGAHALAEGDGSAQLADPSAAIALLQAYGEALEPYHSWVLRQAFRYCPRGPERTREDRRGPEMTRDATRWHEMA
ncbi:hypothetical protein EMIHUDRAFT_368459 [Emiliania huxleyi CCMP1516]|uniref:Glycolipid transfer protein domain-containing protein n=2 Tax=Emiliania huxleyi TaxID=2903 RepID=A0A0D3JEV7_EMIH1|nr:hypothetical protein EMIHUDRAFT_368459 [Emiliania huxleyi CCMP1516]EOD22042.1 hypothetical protein EMIHUDRAFT_368459 [Emiliania huxleyi CCMP1516]|eukprot:XP_005774471.1 hypothetical protein EMIHUDRAFT_368459 [Emiliania huxleyi CCMP1516]